MRRCFVIAELDGRTLQPKPYHQVGAVFYPLGRGYGPAITGGTAINRGLARAAETGVAGISALVNPKRMLAVRTEVPDDRQQEEVERILFTMRPNTFGPSKRKDNPFYVANGGCSCCLPLRPPPARSAPLLHLTVVVADARVGANGQACIYELDIADALEDILHDLFKKGLEDVTLEHEVMCVQTNSLLLRRSC